MGKPSGDATLSMKVRLLSPRLTTRSIHELAVVGLDDVYVLVTDRADEPAVLVVKVDIPPTPFALPQQILWMLVTAVCTPVCVLRYTLDWYEMQPRMTEGIGVTE